MKIKAAITSDVGTTRNINQDNYFFLRKINKNAHPIKRHRNIISRKRALFAVFDGMGGEQSGERASFLAAQKCKSLYTGRVKSFEPFTQQYMFAANQCLCEYMTANGDISMGTTAAMIYIDTDKKSAWMANIGDSKIFHIRGNKINKLTQDHNVAAELERAGIITEDEAYRHRDKNKLTQYLGIYEEDMVIEPFLTDVVPVLAGDSFIVCSDGLTDSVSKTEILSIIKSKIPVRKKADMFVKKAKENGSKDNITVIVISIA